MPTTDTTPADNQQLAGIFAALQQPNPFGQDFDCCTSGRRHLVPQQGDPQWAGPSLPHPTEAGSEAERAELDEGWDNWQHGIERNASEEATL